MKKLLQTILFDLFMTAIVVFFLYQFVLFAKLDQYIVRTIIKSINTELSLNTDIINFSYRFPFTVKAQHIAIGEKSMIGTVSISIDPVVLILTGDARISEIKIEDAMLTQADIIEFGKQFTSKNDTKKNNAVSVSADSIILKRVYFAMDENRFIRIDSSKFGFNYSQDYFSARCDDLKGMAVYGQKKIPLTISSTHFEQSKQLLKVDLEAMFGTSELSVHAQREAGLYSGNVVIDKLQISDVSGGAAEGSVSVYSRITGKGKLPVIDGSVMIEGGRYNQFIINNGRYRFKFGDGRLSVHDIVLTSKTTVFKGYIASTLTGVPAVDGKFVIEHFNIADVMAGPYNTDINANVEFSGNGAKWDDFSGTLNVSEIAGRCQSTVLSNGNVKVVKDKKLLTIESMYLKTGEGSIDAEGSLYGKYFSFSLNTNRLPIEMLSPGFQVTGSADFKGVLNKDASGISGSGLLTTYSVKYGPVSVTKLFASLSLGAKNGSVSLFVNDASVKGLPAIKFGKVSGEFSSDTIVLKQCDMTFNDDHSIAAAFTANRSAQDKAWLSSDASVTWKIKKWAVRCTAASVLFGEQISSVSGLHLTDGASDLNASFHADRSKNSVQATVNGMIDIAQINRYKEIFPDVEGQIAVNADFSRDDGVVKSSLSLHMPYFIMVYNNFSQTRIDDFTVRAAYDTDHYRIDEVSFVVDKEKNILTGTADIDLRGKPVFNSFRIHGTITKMYASFLANFATTDVSVTEGYFRGPIDFVYGKDIKLNADVHLFDTQLIVFAIGNAVVERMSGHATVVDNDLTIEYIDGIANERGKVRLSGTISDIINDRTLNLKIVFSGLYVPNLWYFSGFANGTVEIIGKGHDEILQGDITVDSGIWNAPFSAFSKSGRKNLSGLNMNIHLQGENNIWWRNDSVNIEFGVDFTLKKIYLEDKTVLSGTMQSLKGTFYFLDVPFNVVNGQLIFTNPDDITPDLNIQGETEVFYLGRKKIRLYVTGSLAEPKITLTSDDPSLTQNDLLALLTFNRPMNELENTSFMNEKAGEWATFYLQQRLLKPLKRSSVLDTLNVRGNLLSDKDRYLDVEVGKYLGNSFYVVYRNEMVKGQNQRFNVIYYINNNLSLETGAEEEKGEMKYNVDMKLKFKY